MNDSESETKIIGELKKRNIVKYVKPEIQGTRILSQKDCRLLCALLCLAAAMFLSR